MHRTQGVFNHTEDYVLLPDERTISLCCWDSRTAERKNLLSLGHNNIVRCIVHSPTNPGFMTCSDDFRARFWYRRTTTDWATRGCLTLVKPSLTSANTRSLLQSFSVQWKEDSGIRETVLRRKNQSCGFLFYDLLKSVETSVVTLSSHFLDIILQVWLVFHFYILCMSLCCNSDF